jgi:hypothetical protein
MAPVRPDTVARTVEAQLLDPESMGLTVAALLFYRASDPYAVSVLFAGDDASVHWVFARDLLARGMHRSSGDGDVRVHPPTHHRFVELELRSPHGRARVGLPAAAAAEFLRATHAVVAPGRESEHLTLDTALVRLLAS